jgi:hypothetical protein
MRAKRKVVEETSNPYVILTYILLESMTRISVRKLQVWSKKRSIVMINIYAQTFMTATRTGQVRVQDMPAASETKRQRWFKRKIFRNIDPKEL